MQFQLPVPATAAMPLPAHLAGLTAQASRKPAPPVASPRCSRVRETDALPDLPYRRWLQWSGNL